MWQAFRASAECVWHCCLGAVPGCGEEKAGEELWSVRNQSGFPAADWPDGQADTAGQGWVVQQQVRTPPLFLVPSSGPGLRPPGETRCQSEAILSTVMAQHPPVRIRAAVPRKEERCLKGRFQQRAPARSPPTGLTAGGDEYVSSSPTPPTPGADQFPAPLSTCFYLGPSSKKLKLF